jgi:hypothetical protein
LNVAATLGQSNFENILARFVSYGALITIPQIYMRQKKMFNIKFDVEDFFLTIFAEKEDIDERSLSAISTDS